MGEGERGRVGRSGVAALGHGGACVLVLFALSLSSCSRAGFAPNDAESPRECGVGSGCDSVLDVTAPPECTTASDCDDTNLCTEDVCDPQGRCQNVANSDPCDDGDPCTGPDSCREGRCEGTPFDASCVPATSQLSVTPGGHRLVIAVGGNPSADHLFVRNTGASDATFTTRAVTEDLVTPCPWIAAAEPAESGPLSPDAFRRVAIRYAATSLGLGLHRCVVQTFDATPGTLPISTPVTLEVKAAPTVSIMQSWEQSGCAADGASSSTGADCDYRGAAALHGNELLLLDYDTSFFADGALGSLGTAEVLYIRIPIYFRSFEGIETPDLFLLRDGGADSYPRIGNWAGANGEERQLFLLCNPASPTGDHNYWPGVNLPVDRWIVIRLRVELASGQVQFYDEGGLWTKAGCSGLPLSYTDLGYAFVTTWGRRLLVDRVEISDTEFAAPLTLP